MHSSASGGYPKTLGFLSHKNKTDSINENTCSQAFYSFTEQPASLRIKGSPKVQDTPQNKNEESRKASSQRSVNKQNKNSNNIQTKRVDKSNNDKKLEQAIKTSSQLKENSDCDTCFDNKVKDNNQKSRQVSKKQKISNIRNKVMKNVQIEDLGDRRVDPSKKASNRQRLQSSSSEASLKSQKSPTNRAQKKTSKYLALQTKGKAKLTTGKNIKNIIKSSYNNEPITDKIRNKNQSTLKQKVHQKSQNKKYLNHSMSAHNTYQRKNQLNSSGTLRQKITAKKKLNSSTKSLQTFANAKLMSQKNMIQSHHNTLEIKQSSSLKKLSLSQSTFSIKIDSKKNFEESQDTHHHHHHQTHDQLLSYLLYGEQKTKQLQQNTGIDQQYTQQSSQQLLIQNDKQTIYSSLQPYHFSSHKQTLKTQLILPHSISPIIQNQHNFIKNVSFQKSIHEDSLSKYSFCREEGNQGITSCLLKISFNRICENSYIGKLSIEQEAISKMLLSGQNQRKMLSYISIKDTVLYMRILMKLRSSPLNIIELQKALTISIASQKQQLTESIRQYLFISNIIFNKNELDHFIHHLIQFSQGVHCYLTKKTDVRLLTEILFFTESITAQTISQFNVQTISMTEKLVRVAWDIYLNQVTVSIWEIIEKLEIALRDQKFIGGRKNSLQTSFIKSIFHDQEIVCGMDPVSAYLFSEGRALLAIFSNWIQKLLMKN